MYLNTKDFRYLTEQFSADKKATSPPNLKDRLYE